MIPFESVLNRLDEEASQMAKEFDYGRTDGRSLFETHRDSIRQAAALVGDFQELSGMMRQVESGRTKLTRQIFEASRRVLDLYVYYWAVRKATTDEIFRRLERNGTNRNFALFKIAEDRGLETVRNETLKQLRRIARSLQFRKRWWHPDGDGEWDSAVNLVLAQELDKIRDEDIHTTVAHMLDNRYAYIYTAFQNKFCDELRTLKRHPDQNPQFTIQVVDVGANVSMDAGLQRSEVIELLESAAPEVERDGGRAILAEGHKMLIENREYLEGANVRQIQAELAKRAARARGVSERQARFDFGRLRAEGGGRNLESLRRQALPGRSGSDVLTLVSSSPDESDE